jgi:hypothetical protein
VQGAERVASRVDHGQNQKCPQMNSQQNAQAMASADEKTQPKETTP